MKFSKEKCSFKNKLRETNGYGQMTDKEIKIFELETAYTYLRILQSHNIKHAEVKSKVTVEYIGRSRKFKDKTKD